MTADDHIRENSRPEEKKESWQKSILLYLHDLIYMLAGIMIAFLLVFRLVIVSGDSMYSTLWDGDLLLVLSNTFYREPEYGDIIVARELSFEDGEPIVKRVIATEHQDVLIKMGDDGHAHVFVDGVELDEPYICEPMFPYYFEQDQDQDPSQFSMTVGEDCIFVMGDNRNNSSDSRVASIGEIKVDQVLGKVLFIVFPGQDEYKVRDFDRIGAVS